MPSYTALEGRAIAPGESRVVWNAEQPTPGTGGVSASTTTALTPRPFGGSGAAFAVDGYFSGAPGTFEIDVQVAQVDADAQYQTVAAGTITAVDATNNTFHFDGTQISAPLVRLLMRTRTNAVNVTASVYQA